MLVMLLIVGISSVLMVAANQFIGQNDIQSAELFVTERVDAPLLMHKMRKGRYPTTEEGLQAVVMGSGSGVGTLEAEQVVDPWGKPYQYKFPATKSESAAYDVWSAGPDGESGTADDIGNW